MYTKNFIYIIGDPISKKDKEIIIDFIYSRFSQETHLKIECNFFIKTIEGCRALAQLNEDSSDISDSVRTLFVTSRSNTIYEDVKKANLLMKSKEYVISRHNKKKLQENIVLSDSDETKVIKINVKERPGKYNAVFRQLNLNTKIRHINF